MLKSDWLIVNSCISEHKVYRKSVRYTETVLQRLALSNVNSDSLSYGGCSPRIFTTIILVELSFYIYLYIWQLRAVFAYLDARNGLDSEIELYAPMIDQFFYSKLIQICLRRMNCYVQYNLNQNAFVRVKTPFSLGFSRNKARREGGGPISVTRVKVENLHVTRVKVYKFELSQG